MLSPQQRMSTPTFCCYRRRRKFIETPRRVGPRRCAARRIFAFLGVSSYAVSVNATLKMGAATPRGDLANADDVAAALAASRWAGEVDLPG